MTHAAIDACLTKLRQLIEFYGQIPNLPIPWLEKLQVEHVIKGNDHPAPAPGHNYVFAGTVYQVSAFAKLVIL